MATCLRAARDEAALNAPASAAPTRSISVDIKSLNATKTYNSATGILTVKDHAGDVATIKFIGTVNLSIKDDGNGGTLVTDPPATSTPQNIANDPPHGFDPSSLAFSGHGPLGLTENRADNDGS